MATKIFLSFPIFLYTQSIDTILQFQTVEIAAPRLQSFQTGIKKATFDTFQQLSTTTQDLATALTLHTPIFIKNYGPGRLATSTIRGASAAQTAVIWNGFNINSPMLGQTDFSLIPAFFIDQIGVQYGSNSTAWGSGAIGGSIILENKNDFNQGWQAGWSSSVGSFDNFFNGLKIGYSTPQFSTTTKVFYQSGQNDFPIENGQSDRLKHSEIKKWGVLQKNGFKVKDNQQLDVNFWYQTNDRNLPPNLLQKNSVANQADESFRTSLNWKLIRNKSIFQIRNGFFYDRLFFQDSIAAIDSRSRTWTNRTEVEWTQKLTPQHQLNIGANHAFLKARSTGYDPQSPTQNRTAIFAMYNWKSLSKKWSTQLSLRQEWVDGDATPFVPSIGFTGNLTNAFTLNATIAKSYRVPTFNDLFWQNQGNQNLLSEDGWNQEVGLHYQSKKQLQLGMTAYNRTINNWIIWQPENGIWRPNNLLKVWSRGLENTLKWQKDFADIQFRFSFQYDLTFSTNQEAINARDASVGKQLIYVPQHKWNATLQTIYLGWTLAYTHQYTGKTYTLADNSSFLPAYHLDHLAIYKQFKTKERTGHVFAKLNNLFGVNYQVIAQFAMPQRNFEVGWQISL